LYLESHLRIEGIYKQSEYTVINRLDPRIGSRYRAKLDQILLGLIMYFREVSW